MTDATIVSKVWNFANVSRDDGVSYGDYLEQITYLLFLKLADEMNKPPYSKGLAFPKLKDIEGNEIIDGDLCDGIRFLTNVVMNWIHSTTRCLEVWLQKKEFGVKSSPKARIKSRPLLNHPE